MGNGAYAGSSITSYRKLEKSVNSVVFGAENQGSPSDLQVSMMWEGAYMRAVISSTSV